MGVVYRSFFLAAFEMVVYLFVVSGLNHRATFKKRAERLQRDPRGKKDRLFLYDKGGIGSVSSRFWI